MNPNKIWQQPSKLQFVYVALLLIEFPLTITNVKSPFVYYEIKNIVDFCWFLICSPILVLRGRTDLKSCRFWFLDVVHQTPLSVFCRFRKTNMSSTNLYRQLFTNKWKMMGKSSSKPDYNPLGMGQVMRFPSTGLRAFRTAEHFGRFFLRQFVASIFKFWIELELKLEWLEGVSEKSGGLD